MSESPYDSKFFGQQTARSLTSARAVLRMIFQYHKPKSIVDVGCGLGAWLKAAQEQGVDDVLGIDGAYVDRDTLLIPDATFHAADLRRRLTLDRRFDMAISLEVAEHLPYPRSESFVRDLTALSDVVLFSAALPYQGGTDHINEQWLEFWAILFQRDGYVPIDLLRTQFWNDPAVEFWYSQNMVVFCTPDFAARTFPREFLASGRPLSYPHPLTFLVNVARYRPLSASAVDLECEDYLSVLRTYQEGDSTLPLMRMPDAVNEVGSPLFPDSRTLIVDARAEGAARDAEVERREEELARLSAGVRGKEEEIDRLSNELSVRDLATRQMTSQLTARKSEISRLKDELHVRQEAFSRLSVALDAEICEMRRRGDELARQAASLKEATALAAAELAALRNSLSWRITKPLRKCIEWATVR